MINAFLPKEKVFIPELDTVGTITAVRMTSFGTEYLVRYASEGVFYEVYLYDFEVSRLDAGRSHN